MSPPLVSVIMAARNHALYVRDAMESVLSQTYGNVELIVVDDASSDATADVAAEVAAEHRGAVRLVCSSSWRGVAAARSEALGLARGELVALLDSDDLWLPEKLERQVPVLERRPEVGLVYSDFEAFDSDSGTRVPWGEPAPEVADPLKELYRRGCYVMTGTVLIRLAAIDRRGLDFWNPGYPSYDDYLLFLALALDWQFARVPETLMRYRRHESNLTDLLFTGNVPLARVGLLESFRARFPDADERLGRARRAWLATHLMNAAAFERGRGEWVRAAEITARGLVTHPRTALAWVARALRDRAGPRRETAPT